jgi:hypothetical protein
MSVNETLKLEVEKQVAAGFNLQEIEENLRAKGYSDAEIKEATSDKHIQSAVLETNSGSVSGKSIAIGILFLVVAVWRLSRYSNGGNIFLGIGVITAIILALLHFTKKR